MWLGQDGCLANSAAPNGQGLCQTPAVRHASYEVAHVEIMEGLSNYVATQDISASGDELNVLHMAYDSALPFLRHSSVFRSA